MPHDLLQGASFHSENSGLRNLRQVGEVTVVTTAEGLRAALDVGAQHIEIHEHLDLTGLELEAANRILGVIPESVRSIRVRNRSHSYTFSACSFVLALGGLFVGDVCAVRCLMWSRYLALLR